MSQYRWESGERNTYTIAEDDTEPIDGSGTRIVLHLKEDSEEYLDDFKVGYLYLGQILLAPRLVMSRGDGGVEWEDVNFVSCGSTTK